MASYTFEVGTEHGAQRYAFTLDDDRALGPQVAQVLEELRQRGVMLKGGLEDELAIGWAGRELDGTKRPAELGISSSHPLELRMRPRAAVDNTIRDTSLPKGVLASVVFGYLGAFCAWLAMPLASGVTSLAASYPRLDQVTMFLLGGLVGAFVLGGAAIRTRRSALLAGGAGLGLGGAGALIGVSLAFLLPGMDSLRGFLLMRILGWGLAGGLAACLLSMFGPHLDARRSMESLLIGLLGGAASGIMFALPGPAEVWQAVAFLLFGSATALAAAGPGFWRATAVVEQMSASVPNLFSLREWPLHEGTAVRLGATQVGCSQGRIAVYPSPAGAVVSGRRVTEPQFLPGDSVLQVDTGTYRVRLHGTAA